MGHSNTARYGAGQQLYGPAAAWPADVRAQWTRVVAAASRRLGVPTAVAASVGNARPAPASSTTLRQTISDPVIAPRLRAMSRKWGVDEAEAALVWSSCDGPLARRRALAEGKLAVLALAEATLLQELRVTRPRGRVPDAVRLALRTASLAAVARLPAAHVPRARDVETWPTTPAGARFFRACHAWPRA